MTDIWTAVGTVVVTLFGVWRMLAHYEPRNDAAHAELGRRIDNLDNSINNRIDNLDSRINHRIDNLNDSISNRIDNLHSLISSQKT